MAEQTDNNLLTIQQVADLCHVDYDTALKWCRVGALAFIEVGPTRIKRVYRKDALAMLQPAKPTATSAG
jgi:hypothetical protein